MEIKFIRNVYPGDNIPEEGIKSFGIYENKAIVLGQLSKIEDLYFIKSKTNKYAPMKYDIVIGKIVLKSPDFYKVDLGGYTGTLSTLGFVNASKKNKPDLQKGDYVLCQVLRTDGDLLLTCNQPGLGKVDDMHAIESWKVRVLYFNNMLQKLGSEYTFRIAMAMNGYLWFDCDPKTQRTLLKLLNEF